MDVKDIMESMGPRSSMKDDLNRGLGLKGRLVTAHRHNDMPGGDVILLKGMTDMCPRKGVMNMRRARTVGYTTRGAIELIDKEHC